MPQLRVALAQVNPRVGDLSGNADLVLDWCRRAHEAGAHLVAFPEMVLTGYPIEDLALRSSIIRASRARVESLAAELEEQGLGDLVVYVGHLGQADPAVEGPGIPKNAPTNAVAIVHGGRVVARQAKHHLWNYGVGDELRTYVAGDTITVARIHGVDVALAICEDIWRDGPSQVAKAAGAALLVVPNGSPYEAAKDDFRHELVERRAREGECTIAYVNQVGGQDELVFDGDSIVVGSDGGTIARAQQFVEELLVADLDLPAATDDLPEPDQRFDDGLRAERVVISTEPVPTYEPVDAPVHERWDDLGERYQAIVLGLRDYVEKNGAQSVLIGLSGGIDSTLVAAVAVDALGPDRVFGVSNPSDWSTEGSRTDAAELARRTGLELDTVPIAPIFEAYQDALHLTGVAEENLQARVRAVIWMGLSNEHGHLVLACGNKSEIATGYSTIYGDAVGGYAPIKDVPKTLVWELSRWRNQWAEKQGETPPIPEGVIAKPPSAELRPGQLDSDSLPDYDVLDAVLDAYVERDLGAADVVAEGFDAELVERVVTLVDRAEYKRRQYPPGPKISVRNFGRDRRVPITNAWRESL